jgi:hypothetical protein
MKKIAVVVMMLCGIVAGAQDITGNYPPDEPTFLIERGASLKVAYNGQIYSMEEFKNLSPSIKQPQRKSENAIKLYPFPCILEISPNIAYADEYECRVVYEFKTDLQNEDKIIGCNTQLYIGDNTNGVPILTKPNNLCYPDNPMFFEIINYSIGAVGRALVNTNIPWPVPESSISPEYIGTVAVPLPDDYTWEDKEEGVKYYALKPGTYSLSFSVERTKTGWQDAEPATFELLYTDESFFDAFAVKRMQTSKDSLIKQIEQNVYTALEDAKLEAFDMLGRKVSDNGDLRSLSNAMYILRAVSEKKVEIKKVVKQ